MDVKHTKTEADKSNETKVPAFVKRNVMPIKAQNKAAMRISLRKEVK
jgi:hypothetical protein